MSNQEKPFPRYFVHRTGFTDGIILIKSHNATEVSCHRENGSIVECHGLIDSFEGWVAEGIWMEVSADEASSILNASNPLSGLVAIGREKQGIRNAGEDERLNLYLLTQKANTGYDTFDSCVVAAKDEADAKTISPGHSYLYKDAGPDGRFEDNSAWAYNTSEVVAELIGVAKPETRRGAICSSFNAG